MSNDKDDLKKRYWRTNIRYLAILLSIWFIVSYGCGILFVDQLNQYRIGHAKLGFWFAQQGSIYVFVILIAVYVLLMNRLDRKYGFRED
jgi:putative solute:sodium symporter small subunit